ncbi:hypothetical protein IF2G_10958 [Cordyceps javanica]|nr:hypothetical protein IF2G_10958 [Cordyceps javanica]
MCQLRRSSSQHCLKLTLMPGCSLRDAAEMDVLRMKVRRGLQDCAYTDDVYICSSIQQ